MLPAPLVDAHTHLDRYGEDLGAALAEIERGPILTWSVSMDVPSYHKAIEIASASPWVLASFGIHPWEAPRYADRCRDLDTLIASSPVLGEIGLDHHFVKDQRSHEAQLRVLEHFFRAAREQRKLVNLHTKGAEELVLRLLDRYQLDAVVVHWYSGPRSVLQELVARGTYFTVGVELLSSPRIREIARLIPKDRLLTETDNPGGFRWLSGKPGMPDLVREVLASLAELHRTEVAAISQLVYANLRSLLGPLWPWPAPAPEPPEA